MNEMKTLEKGMKKKLENVKVKVAKSKEQYELNIYNAQPSLMADMNLPIIYSETFSNSTANMGRDRS